MSIPEIVFPRTRGPVGATLNSRVNPDFDGIEYTGWATKKPKVTWAADPAGGPLLVTRWQIDQGDYCNDQYGPDGQRIELWKENSAQNEGEEAWIAFNWFLGDGTTGDLFRYPQSWALMWQNHGISEGGSPVQALEVNGAGQWIWNPRKTNSDETGRKPIGAATRGHWHHFLVYCKFTTATSGSLKVWHSLDVPPDPATPPDDSRTMNTLVSKPSRPNLHMYRDPNGAAAEYPWIAYNAGFARAATASRALELAWPVATTPPPQPPPPAPAPDVPAAIGHITKTLNWLRAPKPGGLGYTIAKVQQSNAYKALVDLGGRWP